MPIGLVGRKAGMTRLFTDAGESIPVTVVVVEPNRVTRLKTQEKDGYRAVQLTAGSKKPSRLPKPQAGHLAKTGVEAGEGLWEFRLDDDEGEGAMVARDLVDDPRGDGEDPVYGHDGPPCLTKWRNASSRVASLFPVAARSSSGLPRATTRPS